MITKFSEPPFDGEYKNEYNELLWCQDVLKNMGKELQRKHSTLIDNEASEYRYRDEIVNLLLAPIFHDVEEYIWLETEMGFVEVVGNVLIKNTSSKNDDLEKLLKVESVKVPSRFDEVHNAEGHKNN
ncbi:20338_t:CDS:2 [Entrophospora sp. SA101]|nr:20338_t:CDS:2 [Entrophospora sp. SA101]